jgi:hypothetical protein
MSIQGRRGPREQNARDHRVSRPNVDARLLLSSEIDSLQVNQPTHYDDH